MNLDKDCSFKVYDDAIMARSIPFDCGEPDLNDFFLNEALDYSLQLLGRSYCFVNKKKPSEIVTIFTISNASIKVSNLPNNARRRLGKAIPWSKQGNNYPAVLIGRLGVSLNYIRHGVGTQVLGFIKTWFIDSKNKTGCRFVIVDAYNKSQALDFYIKNGFNFLFKDEVAEKEYNGIASDGNLKTRQMYFDLITYRQAF